MYIYNLLIFVGCLVLYVQCQIICKKDQYTVVSSDGSFLRCLNCLTCHAGRGLYPPCGSRIQDPPNPDCIACPAGKFSGELDSSPCHNCQRCAEHEIITAPCTNQSNRICNGTCEAGFFYSKKDSTHSCQKCSYCCSDGYDEEISECANQGLKASKQHCRPRPDKDCSPGSLLISTTIHTTGPRTKASRNGNSISGSVIGGVVGGGIGGIVFILVVVLVCLYCQKRTRGVSDEQQSARVKEGNGKASYTSYASEGPQLASANTPRVTFTVPADKNLKPQVNLTVDEMSALEQKFGETAAATTANPADDKIEKSPDVKMSSKSSLSGQSSQDSQNSGDGETGFRKRSNSALRIEKLTRKLSEKDDSLLEEDTDGLQEPITIVKELSSQKIKEGSKVELVFKCKAAGNSKLTYQWFKDGTELQGKDEGTLVLKSVTLRDFGCYKCVASCEDSSSVSVESLAELNVTPRDGTTYKCLVDVDFNTQDRIGSLLTQERYSLGWWRQVAFKYGMDQLSIQSLENDQKAGKKTLDFLRSSNPDLIVYDFCKTLKDHNIRRLDIVKELLEHLSVPSSSNVYV